MGNKNIDANYSMALNNTIKRELEVAFSKHSQPGWFRVLKYILLGVSCTFSGEPNYCGSSYSLCLLLPCCYIFGTGIKHMAGQKVMACGNMKRTEATIEYNLSIHDKILNEQGCKIGY
jgi:hypothetical protein